MITRRIGPWVSLAREAVRGSIEHRSFRMGAALAYYTIFSIAPLFLLILAMAGLWFGRDRAKEALFAQVQQLIGEQGGRAIEALVASAEKPAAGAWSTVVAITTMLVGATGVFAQLQDVLNSIWEVRPKAGAGLKHFVKDRLLSFAMILSIGFLLLVSLVLSAAIAAVGKVMGGLFPAEALIWQLANVGASLLLSAALFALIFKILPDVKVRWRDVWVGALLSSILFNIGKLALGVYLGRSSFTSAYGAAGSLVVVLVWVYYASQILFLGAEFTKAYSRRSGHEPPPKPGAELTNKIQAPGQA